MPPEDLSQVSFVVLDNYIVNRIKGGLMKRGGSKTWSTTGTTYGLGEFIKSQSSLLLPDTSYVTRHRRTGGVSSFEYYNQGIDTWSTITLGSVATAGTFGASGITQFAQCGTLMAICGGQPAKLVDPVAGTIERLGGPAPSAAPTWGTSGTGLTGQAAGVYTFFDPTTGWESSPSPATAITTLANKQINWSALQTTCAREGVTQKRLYRQQVAGNGEGPYYLVTTLALATTGYADTVADASLGLQAPDQNDHDPPPTTSYIVAEYAGVIWVASGNALYHSKTYDGNNYQLEYYSPARVDYFPGRITGLAYSPDFGRLLVFCSPGRGIHYISGNSEDTFAQDVFKKAEGTHFPSSVCVHEDRVAYWGTNGPCVVNPSGAVKTFGDDIKESIRQICTKEYNSDVWVFCYWHPVMEQFHWYLSVTDNSAAQWGNVAIGTDALWEDIVTGNVVEWG